MKTLTIQAADYNDFCQQVRDFLKNNPTALGIDEDRLPDIWDYRNHEVRDGKTAVRLAYRFPDEAREDTLPA